MFAVSMTMDASKSQPVIGRPMIHPDTDGVSAVRTHLNRPPLVALDTDCTETGTELKIIVSKKNDDERR